MDKELLDYFDENYTKLGAADKAETRSKGYWVHSFHCWILHTGNEAALFFQKRASTKSLFPNLLDISAAGHLRSGEAVADGVREISEEVGLDVSPKQLISLGIKLDIAKLPGIINRQFCHVFLLPTPSAISDMRLDQTELDGMVLIKITDGLRLFSGEADSVAATGVEKNGAGKWSKVDKKVTTKDFIPRVDSYYYKMFINADLFLQGYKYLSI